MKLSHAVSFVCGAAAAMIAFTMIGGHGYDVVDTARSATKSNEWIS